MLAYESVEYQVVERLREDSHEVLYLAEMEPGVSDTEVLDLSQLRRLVPAILYGEQFAL